MLGQHRPSEARWKPRTRHRRTRRPGCETTPFRPPFGRVARSKASARYKTRARSFRSSGRQCWRASAINRAPRRKWFRTVISPSQGSELRSGQPLAFSEMACDVGENQRGKEQPRIFSSRFFRFAAQPPSWVFAFYGLRHADSTLRRGSMIQPKFTGCGKSGLGVVHREAQAAMLRPAL